MLAHTPIRRSTSPDFASVNTDQKRKRKTFSCYDCRRKKLRCDRLYPTCGRCQSAGRASSCAYESQQSDFESDPNLTLSKPGRSDTLNTISTPTAVRHVASH